MATPKKKTGKSSSLKKTLGAENQILTTYMELCHRIGVANVTLQKIADQANVAFGTVRYYFSSEKRSLHDEAFQLMLNKSYQAVEEIFFELRKKDSFDPVLAYAETMFQWVFARPVEGSFLIYLYYLSSTQQEMKIMGSATVQ